MPSLVCPKCGNIKKSGKRSCCARGGAWFKNCGDVADPKFDHTWADGMEACRRMLHRATFAGCIVVLDPEPSCPSHPVYLFSMHYQNLGGHLFQFLVLYSHAQIPTEIKIKTSAPAINDSNKCVRCGTIRKSGKRSCCARGGAWFSNCGNAGSTKFDHTWSEGIQACRSFTSSISIESPVQAMLRHVGAIGPPSSTKQAWWNVTHQQKSVYRPGNVPNAGIEDSKNCVGLTKVVVSIHGLFVIMHFQM